MSASSRTPLIAGNWKMHKTVAEAEDLVAGLLPRVAALEGVDVAVCPPFTALGPVVDSVRGSRVAVLAQNMHDQPSGAYTGEISPGMLVDLEVDGVLLGHSERRQHFGETDTALALKVPAALEAGLQTMLAVGETEAERDAGETHARLARQVREGLARVDDDRLAEVVIAYEPIWAIGTGKVATPEQAQEAMSFIRSRIAERSPAAGERARVLYGGSVKPDNARELLALPDCDGALVGGASLDAAGFAAIAEAARA